MFVTGVNGQRKRRKRMANKTAMNCDGKNVVEQTIKICCDSRKDECEDAELMISETGDLIFHVCRKPCKEVKG